MRIFAPISAVAILGLSGCGGEREVAEPIEAEAGEGVIGAREGVEGEEQGVLTEEREVEHEGELGEAGVARGEE